MSGTEDSILNSIPDFRDDGGESDSGTQQTSTHESEGGSDGRSSAPPTTTGTGVGQANSGRNPGNAQTPQPGVVRRLHDGLVEQPNPDDPRTRDLVDPITGRVVAKGGIERRVFEEGQRHARENTQLKQQLQQAAQQIGSRDELSRVAQELNIPQESQIAALRVMSDFLRDPVKTLQMLVEEVKSKGYQIPFLEQGVSPGMDLAAIQRMIDAKMQPITQQHQLAQRQAQERAQAQRVLDNFLSTHPDAEPNLGTIAQMLQAQPGLTIQDAYIKMSNWCVSNGLDYTQPIEPQIAQLQQQPTQQPQQPPANRRPLPNGRSATGNTSMPVDQARSFNENTSWSDIIRHSMQESGLSIT